MNEKKEIIYFSDLLCIWAYISERRLIELRSDFSEVININYRFCSIFGSVPAKIEKSWSGNVDNYAAHVQDLVSAFPFINIHPKLWLINTPTTSTNAHLVIKAAQLIYQNDNSKVESLIFEIRMSFFEKSIDISNIEKLLKICDSQNLQVDKIKERLNSGEAQAALNEDLDLAKSIGVKGSPSFVMNNGRQILYGNVGYRLIKANVEELLNAPKVDLASWC